MQACLPAWLFGLIVLAVAGPAAIRAARDGRSR